MKIPFDVVIPNLNGDGPAETIRVMVSARMRNGQQILSRKSIELIEKTKTRHMGLLSPLQIKQLRKSLGATQHQISELLQIGEKTWTRWETGRERPCRSLNVMLMALRDKVITLDYLKTLRH